MKYLMLFLLVPFASFGSVRWSDLISADAKVNRKERMSMNIRCAMEKAKHRTDLEGTNCCWTFVSATSYIGMSNEWWVIRFVRPIEDYEALIGRCVVIDRNGLSNLGCWCPNQFMSLPHPKSGDLKLHDFINGGIPLEDIVKLQWIDTRDSEYIHHGEWHLRTIADTNKANALKKYPSIFLTRGSDCGKVREGSAKTDEDKTDVERFKKKRVWQDKEIQVEVDI